MLHRELLTIYNLASTVTCHITRKTCEGRIAFGSGIFSKLQNLFRLSSNIPAIMENNQRETEKSDSETGVSTGVKRPIDDEVTADSAVDVKKSKLANSAATETQNPTSLSASARRKKVAMLLVYSGKGYQGMQRNPGTRTIESDLMDAFVSAGVITKDHAEKPGETMQFQRAARTDKGVSAAGQVVSLKVFVDVENPIEKINGYLCDQIRTVGMKRVTKKYDSKNAATARTYMYMLPTIAFCPVHEIANDNYRITDDTLRRVNEILLMFKGTHNFHNFTSGKKQHDPSAKRYIMEFTAGKPFVRDDMELVVLSVRGQSFVLHQIRKMIGLAVAVVRGLTGSDAIVKAFGKEKCDVPKAPGLGLILDQVHYDYYNKKFGTDGTHEALLWDEYKDVIDDFKEKHIFPTIIQTEKEEKSMLRWMSTLHLHKFDVIPPPGTKDIRCPVAQASNLVAQSKTSNASSESTDQPCDSKAEAVG